MTDFLEMSKQKTPPKRILERGGGGYTGMGKYSVGEDSEIPPSFRRKLSVSRIPTLNYRLGLVFAI